MTRLQRSPRPSRTRAPGSTTSSAAGSPAASCERWVERGVRGITSNPSIFQKAIEGTADYDDQLRALVADGTSVDDTYWDLVTADIRDALADPAPGLRRQRRRRRLRVGRGGPVAGPRHRRHHRVGPPPARDHRRAQPLREDPRHGRGPARHPPDDQRGPQHQRHAALLASSATPRSSRPTWPGSRPAPATCRAVSSVASFFVSRVDTEVDHRLEQIGTDEALALRGKAAVANAKLAYQLFLEQRSPAPAGRRWPPGAPGCSGRCGRRRRPRTPPTPTRSTSTSSSGPHTVNTIPDATLDAFDDHGTVARTVDQGVDEARADLDGLAAVGVDLADVTRVLEDEGRGVVLQVVRRAAGQPGRPRPRPSGG